MKFSHVFGVAALVLPMMASATDAASSIEISPVSQFWRLNRYHVVEQAGKSVVTVWLSPRTTLYVSGHIQAQAFDTDGNVIATSECKSTTGPLSSRQRHASNGDYAQIAFRSLLPTGATIKVGVSHNQNCAPPTYFALENV